jgi:hypothetical protein
MTANNSDIDTAAVFAERRGIGVRHSAAGLLEYDLTVVGRDALDVVGAAGGWLCDRVRAGWRVSAVLTDGVDDGPLQVLGVRSVTAEADPVVLVRSNPAALAVSAELLEADPVLRAEVLRVAERGNTEFTVWGRWQVGRMSPTRHVLSGAARAFKLQALAMAGYSLGTSCSATDSVEEFHSCALWYPPAGPDLMPVG